LPLITVVPESAQVLHGGISIAPTIARLVGPDKNLAGIESVTTIPTEITNVSGAFTRSVPIDTTPLGVVRIAPKQVTVTGEMGVLAERSFGGIPVETGAGAVHELHHHAGPGVRGRARPGAARPVPHPRQPCASSRTSGEAAATPRWAVSRSSRRAASPRAPFPTRSRCGAGPAVAEVVLGTRNVVRRNIRSRPGKG